jgi:DNA-directed RNA polymerase specialized sigma24 family protein
VTKAGDESSDLGGNGSFSVAVVRLLEALQSEGPEAGNPDDLTVVLDGLSRFLRVRFPTLSNADVADIADESLLRLLEASRAGRLDPARSPAPYLTRIAHNLAVSRLRQPLGLELEENLAEPDDDDLARLLDARATDERLKAALQRAAEAGDHMVIRVARVWLDLAQVGRAAPPSRDVAERLGVSHTTVNEALARLRGYLPG